MSFVWSACWESQDCKGHRHDKQLLKLSVGGSILVLMTSHTETEGVSMSSRLFRGTARVAGTIGFSGVLQRKNAKAKQQNLLT